MWGVSLEAQTDFSCICLYMQYMASTSSPGSQLLGLSDHLFTLFLEFEIKLSMSTITAVIELEKLRELV